METFQNLSLEEFESKWKKSLENCHVYLNQLLTKNSSKTSSFLETFNNLSFDLDNIFGETSTLGKLHPNKELRDNADAMMVEARNFLTELSLNSDLYQNFSSLNETKDPLENRLIQKTIEDFKRSRVDKDEKTRDEIKI